MPPKRARIDKSKAEDEPPEAPSPATEERKARADEKKRTALASKRAMLKGEVEESKKEESTPSPVKKKSKDDDEADGTNIGDTPKKFDPMKILAQANIGKIVDTTTPGFMPLELDSPQLDSDSFSSQSSLSPGLQLGNLSLNCSDSPEQAASILHEAGENAAKGKKDGNYAAGLENIVGSAVVFLKKTDKEVRGQKGGVVLKRINNKKKGPDSLNAPYKRGKNIIGNKVFITSLSNKEDLALLERTYSAAELVLLSSPVYALESVHKKAIHSIHKTRLANEKAGVQEAMTINQCLAWLARAASCEISQLIPSGEYNPDAEDYLRIRLNLQALPLSRNTCLDHDESKWAAYQVKRCLQMMAVADLRPLVPDDRAILLFAIGMLYIDDGANEFVREAAENTVRNVIASCEDTTQLFEPLFNLTPLIVRRPDEAHKWIIMFKNSGLVSAELLISLGASHFVFVCERAECTPDSFYYPTPSATFTTYIDVLTDTIIDVFAVYNALPHRRYHRSLVSILNIVLTPTALRECEEKSKRALLKGVAAVIKRLNADMPEDAIVITELRTLTRRVEREQDTRLGRRTSQEVKILLEERRIRKKEKAEQLKGGKKKENKKEDEEEKRVELSDEEEEEEGSEEMRERSRREERENEEDEEDDEEEEEDGEKRKEKEKEDLKSLLDLLSSDGEKSEGEMDELNEEEEKKKKKKKEAATTRASRPTDDLMEPDD